MKPATGRLLLHLIASGIVCALTVPGALAAGQADHCYNADHKCYYNGKKGCSQSNYQGNRNVTMNDIPCQKWTLQYPHSHRFGKAELPENYCRNPDGEIGPWCYTIKSAIRWQLCFDDCPESNYCYNDNWECYSNGDDLCRGVNYQGDENMTKNNITCQKWHLKNPHSHRFWNIGLKENYCRNPDGEPGPWCYTVNPTIRWELCFNDCYDFPRGIYIMEGHKQEQDDSNIIYNPLSNKTFNLPQLFDHDHMWATFKRFNGCIYAIGGLFSYGIIGFPTYTVQVLCNGESSFVNFKRMLVSRLYPSVCSLPDKLLVCGGIRDPYNKIKNSCEYLDTEGKWIPAGSQNKVRMSSAGVVANGSCYSISGDIDSEKTMEIYHNNNDSWSIVDKSVPVASCLVVEIHGVIYICSRKEFKCYSYNSMDKKWSDPITDNYENATDVSVTEDYAMLATFDGKLYYMGLGESSKEIYVYHPDNQIWFQAPDLKRARKKGRTVTG